MRRDMFDIDLMKALPKLKRSKIKRYGVKLQSNAGVCINAIPDFDKLTKGASSAAVFVIEVIVSNDDASEQFFCRLTDHLFEVADIPAKCGVSFRSFSFPEDFMVQVLSMAVAEFISEYAVIEIAFNEEDGTVEFELEIAELHFITRGKMSRDEVNKRVLKIEF